MSKPQQPPVCEACMGTGKRRVFKILARHDPDERDAVSELPAIPTRAPVIETLVKQIC